jgi:phosphoribosylformylglycinamidine synthase
MVQNFLVEVKIRLKKGVADPEGKNTKKALGLLGFKNVLDVKSVKTIELTLGAMNEDEARAEVEKMCRRLLANPVIHNYEIDVRQI